MEKTKVKSICYYDGYSIKGSGSVELRFKFPVIYLSESLGFISLIGKPIKLMCKIDETKYKLGIFSIYRMSIDRDGEMLMVFRSQKESVDLSSFLPLLEDEIQIMLLATESETY